MGRKGKKSQVKKGLSNIVSLAKDVNNSNKVMIKLNTYVLKITTCGIPYKKYILKLCFKFVFDFYF